MKSDAAIRLAIYKQYYFRCCMRRKKTAEVIGRALNERGFKRNMCKQYIKYVDFSQDADAEETWNSFAYTECYKMTTKWLDILIKQIDEWRASNGGKIAADAVRGF